MTHKLPAVPYTEAAYTEIGDADYYPLPGEQDMKTVTHKLYPVSYINDDGKQINSLYTFDPSNVDSSYFVGDALEIVASHPADMGAKSLQAKIAELEDKLDKLKGEQQ